MIDYETKLMLDNTEIAEATGLVNKNVYTLKELCDKIKLSPSLTESFDWGFDVLSGTLKRSFPKGGSVGWGQVVAEKA